MPVIQRAKKQIRGKQVHQYLVTLPVADVRALAWDKGKIELEVQTVGQHGLLLWDGQDPSLEVRVLNNRSILLQATSSKRPSLKEKQSPETAQLSLF